MTSPSLRQSILIFAVALVAVPQLAILLPVSGAIERGGGVLLIAVLSLGLAVTSAFWLARQVTRPVREMTQVVRRMSEGVYDEPLTVSRSDELGELAVALNGMQRAVADREKDIFRVAHHDSLSGLPNRELVVGLLRDMLADADELAVVSLALNRFNGIVSTLGHRAGEELIERVAGLLRAEVDEPHILGHVNRHEFVLVLRGYDREAALGFVRRISNALDVGVKASGANVSLQATAGIACSPQHGRDAAELLGRASIARNDAELRFEPMAVYHLGQEDQTLEQIRLAGEFLEAVRHNELELYFEPKIDCTTRQVTGAEALVRWRHPEHGLLMPDGFIEAVERAGSIATLTHWVVGKAAAHCARWRQMGLDIALSVNLSVADLADEHLPYHLLDIAKRNGLRPRNFTFEVNESAIMHNVQMCPFVIGCMRELGFRVAVDAFGAGHSALAQLKRLPLDELKIDESFVMNMSSRKDEAIVRAAVDLGHELALSVVAEGVDSAQTLERLAALGCEQAQGNHVGEPLPAADFPAWVRRFTAERSSSSPTLVRREEKARHQACRAAQ